MRYIHTVIGILFVAGILVVPATAFISKQPIVKIEESGDADSAVDYSLS